MFDSGRTVYQAATFFYLIYPEDGNFNVYQNGIASIQDAAKPQRPKFYFR
jgi:hypothetical protein